MEALLYGCMTCPPRRDHYRLLRRTHHRLLLRVIGYRRERGTYQQLLYAEALKKAGCQKCGSYHSTTATFVRGSHCQTTRRAPPEAADGRKTSRGGRFRQGTPRQNLLGCLKDDFQEFEATDGSTVDNRPTFGVDRAIWTLAAKMDDGAPWHKGCCRERNIS